METKPRPSQTAFRLSEEGRALLDALSQRLGVNRTAVIELAIRDKAKAEGVKAAAEKAGSSDADA